MRPLTFDSNTVAASDRLAIFRQGAKDFIVDTVTDPALFAVRWHLLALGDLNAIHSTVTPLHYRRDRSMIEMDYEDRIAIHFYVSGGASGRLGDRKVKVAAGGALVWDLACEIDVRATGPAEMLIVTLPRYMLDEVMSRKSYCAALRPSSELALATEQLSYFLSNSTTLASEAAPYLGRALRDLFAVAILSELSDGRDGTERDDRALVHRISEVVDADPRIPHDAVTLADRVGASSQEIERHAARVGGVNRLVELRRLLAAYRRLCNPADTAPVGTIAWDSGFPDLSRFDRRFRDAFHASPSEIRKFRRGGLPTWAGAYHVEKDYAALRLMMTPETREEGC